MSLEFKREIETLHKIIELSEPKKIKGVSFQQLKKLFSMMGYVGNLELKIVKDKNDNNIDNIIITNEMKYECEDCDEGFKFYLSDYNMNAKCDKCDNGYIKIKEDDDIRIIYKDI